MIALTITSNAFTPFFFRQELTHTLDITHAKLQRQAEYQKVLGDRIKEVNEANGQRILQLSIKIWETEDRKSQIALLKQQILALRQDVQQKAAKLELVESYKKGLRKKINGRRIAEKRRRARRKVKRNSG